MNFPIALQLYTVRDDMAKDFEGTLRKVKAMGYDGVEFAGLFGKSAAEIKALCAEIGLNPISAHVPYLNMVADEKLLEVYAEIGCKFVVIPYLTEEYRPNVNPDNFRRVIADAKRLGQRAKELGMTLAYHNHDFEFAKLDGKYALDLLFESVPQDLLQAELDTCWVNVGGEPPAEYMKKYAGRLDILHLKDFVGQKAANMYALIGLKNTENNQAEPQKFEFRPVGEGVQDFPAILASAEECGTQWVVVEQDRPCLGYTPMECAERSVRYLRSL
ncbi:MAG: sugar phosphate isomerase/epimerase [Clostridia bacterium]|nr:sugar phosphate isomerase/epimerase [Clostridia bacterium]